MIKTVVSCWATARASCGHLSWHIILKDIGLNEAQGLNAWPDISIRQRASWLSSSFPEFVCLQVSPRDETKPGSTYFSLRATNRREVALAALLQNHKKIP